MNIRKLYLPRSLSQLDFTRNKNGHLICDIHRLLKARGFYSGPDHDLYDSGTQEAVLRFQQAEKIAPTGLIDAATYCRLCNGATTEITPAKDDCRTRVQIARGTILINKARRQITLLNGNTAIRQYPCAIGKPSTPTPEGNFAVATKILNPGGVLGTRWMGLNFDAYGIHGTNAPWFIGQMVSNGCIRMHNAHAEELFVLIGVGTPVVIRQ